MTALQIEGCKFEPRPVGTESVFLSVTMIFHESDVYKSKFLDFTLLSAFSSNF